MATCGNQNDNLAYVAAGRPGIALTLVGGGSNSNSGSGMEGGSARESMRFTLRQAWNGQAASGTVNGVKVAATPFRAVNNAGDLLSRLNYSCGGSCQSFQSRPNMHGLKQKFGSVQSTCVPSAIYNSLQMNDTIPASACNVKFVYDSSDYTTYLKQKAVNKNYNDLSYSGNGSNGAQSAMRHIKRF